MIIHTNVPQSRKRKSAKARQLEQEWNQLLQRWEPKKVVKGLSPKVAQPYRRETQHVPSLSTFAGSCTKPEPVKYTGNAIVGIATMHKSNAVPVFSQEDAIEISRMRRG